MTEKRAIVIDDDIDSAEVYAQAVRAAGYSTEIAHEGNTALAIIESQTPDLVVLDLWLPFVSGSEIMEYISSQTHLDQMRLIVVTADSIQSQSIQAAVGRADRVLLKPVTFSQLLKEVKRLED